MKVTQASPMLMTLKDNNYGQSLTGFILFALGGFAAFYLMTKSSAFSIPELFPVSIGAVFCLVGLYLMLSNKTVAIAFDKGTGQCTLSTASLFKREKEELQISRIKALILQNDLRRSRSKGSTSSYYQFTLKLVLESGEEKPFEFGRVQIGVLSALSAPDAPIRNDARRVAEFLLVPLTESGSPCISDLRSALKSSMDDAIAKKKAEKGG